MKTIQPIKNLKDRVKAPTPTHFKKAIIIGLITAGIGFIIRVCLFFFEGSIPIGFEDLSNYMITNGLSLSGISITAKK